jgi:tetratricopeptide (TPR) repeat protein
MFSRESNWIHVLSLLFLAISSINSACAFSFASESKIINVNDTSKVVELNNLFSSLWQTDIDSARKVAFQHLKVAQENNSPLLISDAYNYIGVSYYFQGELNEALKYYELSLNTLEKEKVNEQAFFNVKLNIGRTYVDLGNYSQGIDYLMQSLKIANAKKDYDNLSLALFSISQVYFDLNKLEEALKYYQAAFAFAKKANHQLRISQIAGDIGNVYFMKNDLNQALKFYNYSKKVKQDLNDQVGMSTALINIGNVYELIGDSKDPDLSNDLRVSNYQKALDFYKQSFKISSKLNLKKNESLVLVNLGLLNVKTGKAAEGIENCKRSLKIAEETNTLIRVRDACECLYSAYKDLNEPAKALYYFEKYSQARDSIFSEEHIKKINRLQFEQELELREIMRKAEIERQKELAAIETTQQRFKIRILLVILVILSFAIAFLINQRRKIQLNNKNLVRKNIELMHSETMLIQTQQQLIHEIAESEQNNTEAKTEVNKEPKTIRSNVQDEQNKQLVQEIDRLLIKEKLYLDPDLTLQVLVDKLNSNTSYISRAINEHYGKNFNTLINEFRIKKARKMLADPQFNHLTIEGIARDVGFNSIPSFNNAFKKFTGISPSFFKNSAQNVNED